MVLYNNLSSWAFAAALFVASFSLSGAETRELQKAIGTEICHCAPNAYEFTLDFSLTCPPVNITLGDAVAATTCMVSPFGSPEVADLVPVSVSSIDILELNQNLQVMVQENIEPKESYLDGDTFSYISYAAIPGEIVNPEDLPRAIQLNIVGFNQFGEEIINVYLITFTNVCGAYPVLQEGQFAGWTRFSDLGPPSPELCPGAPEPAMPAVLPTQAPIMPIMSMSMSMDMGLGNADMSEFEDFLEESYKIQDEYESTKIRGKAGKSGKKGKSSKGKDGKSSKGKDGNGKSGKDTKKAQKSEGSVKNSNKLKKSETSKSGSKEGSKAGTKKAQKNEDSVKTTNKLKKSETSKSGSKEGSKSGSKTGSKSGSRGGNSAKRRLRI